MMSVVEGDGALGEQAGNGPTAGGLVRALNSPVRRAALRFLLEKGPASVDEIRRAAPGVVGNSLGHHLKTLIATGTVTQGRKEAGYRERLYSPTDAIRVPWFLEVLQLTAAED